MPQRHIVLVTRDGQACISGMQDPSVPGRFQAWTVPALPFGVRYSSAAAGGEGGGTQGTVFIRSDGQAVVSNERWLGPGPRNMAPEVAWANRDLTQVPPISGDVRYVMAAAGEFHLVLLRSDGQAVTIGGLGAPGGGPGRFHGIAPELPMGVTYTSVAAGVMHTLLVRSDGEAVALSACFADHWTKVPQPPAGSAYVSAACGCSHTILIRSDGCAVVFGEHLDGPVTSTRYNLSKRLHEFERCRVLEPPAGVTYTKAAAGAQHSVLVRSDGVVEALGDNSYQQCSVPDLPDGVTYVSAAAGDIHTVLIRSDGKAEAFGRYIVMADTLEGPGMRISVNACVLPELPAGGHFVENDSGKSVLFTIETKDTGKQIEMTAKFVVSGSEAATLRFSKNRFKTETIGQLRELIADKVGLPLTHVKIIFLDGTVSELKHDCMKMKSLVPEDTSNSVAEMAAETGNQSTAASGYDAAAMLVPSSGACNEPAA